MKAEYLPNSGSRIQLLEAKVAQLVEQIEALTQASQATAASLRTLSDNLAEVEALARMATGVWP